MRGLKRTRSGAMRHLRSAVARGFGAPAASLWGFPLGVYKPWRRVTQSARLAGRRYSVSSTVAIFFAASGNESRLPNGERRCCGSSLRLSSAADAIGL